MSCSSESVILTWLAFIAYFVMSALQITWIPENSCLLAMIAMKEEHKQLYIRVIDQACGQDGQVLFLRVYGPRRGRSP